MVAKTCVRGVFGLNGITKPYYSHTAFLNKCTRALDCATLCAETTKKRTRVLERVLPASHAGAAAGDDPVAHRRQRLVAEAVCGQ